VTPEQQQKLVEWRESWFASWRSCEPAKRDVVQEAITTLYASVERARPEFVWVQSPAEAVDASKRLKPKLRVSVWSVLRSWQQFSAFNFTPELREAHARMFRFAAQSQIFNSPDFPEDSLGINFHYRMTMDRGEAEDTASCALLTFSRDVLGGNGWSERPMTSLPKALDIEARATIAREIWHWWPFRDACIISERPSELMLDDQARLHSLVGPAVTYRDGWSAYAVRGIVVPSEWIKNTKDIPVETALNWPNVEQRRIAAELIGWAKVIEQLNPVVIDQHINPQIGTLLSVTMPPEPGITWQQPQPQLFLRVRCGTGREFVLPVPSFDAAGAPMCRAAQANAWTYDVTEEELLKLEVRT